ncbi:MAG: polysaccharide biosynthesis C-terminal domain-containing protein [Saprospiraceae bacterium]|nr:polysaccharide biosynthesis C-terminal domain-containing protein [Saprospiraceae bacterium]
MSYRGLFNKFKNDLITVYQFSQAARYVQNILLSIALVKSTISLGQIGQFEILVFMAAVLSQFWISGIKDIVVTSWNQGYKDDRSEMLHHGFRSLFLFGLFFSVFLVLFYPVFIQTGSSDIVTGLIPYVCIYFFLNAFSSFPETVLLLREKTNKLFYYTILTSLLFILFLFLFFIKFTNIQFVFEILIGISLIKTIYLLRLISPWHSVSLIKTLSFIKVGIPFFLIAFIGYGMDFIDGFLVVHYFDTEKFPVFKYGARELPFSSLLMNALSVALIPKMVDIEQLGLLKSKADRHMHFLFPLTILLIWISPTVFVWVYNKTFEESALIFNVYLLILGSRILLPHSILMAYGKQNKILWSGVGELLVNIVFSLWWYNYWGIYGLVFATVFAYYIQKVLMLYWLKKECNITIGQLITVRWWILYQVLAFISVYLVFLWKL